MNNFSGLFMTIALVTLNVPVLALLIRLPFIADLRQALKEKSPAGGAADTTSYSRVTGLVGAVILTSFFWTVGNLVIFKAFDKLTDIGILVNNVGRFFMVGTAMFLPYAFNQVRAAFGGAAAGNAGNVKSSALVPPSVNTPVNQQPLKLAIINLSTSIDDETFANTVAAIGVQVSRDFQPEWNSGAALTTARLALNGGQADVDGAVDAIIYVGDTSTDPTTGVSNVSGYHSQNYGQTPYGFVYLDVCAKGGVAWSCTLSHEVLELLADPTAALAVAGPAPADAGGDGQTVNYDLEVCDPTEGDSYRVNNVIVSNFVNKAYFGMAGGSETTNFLNLSLSPFGVRPHGYVHYADSAGPHDIDGSKVDAGRLAARKMLAGWRRNARREARLPH